jgi:glycosyltransferase involved in cell wall biosynthesis
MIAVNPLVSIITISYNSQETINSTVKSILKQTYKNIEYIVIDGNSSDDTLKIVEGYRNQFEEKKIVLKVISEKDKGIADAWNKGLRLATGDIIGILNSDDWYDDNVIEIATKTLNVTQSQISYGICKKIDTSGEVIHIMENGFSANRVYLNFGFSHTTCFATRKVYEVVGDFDLSYKIALDVDFLLRCVKSKVTFIKTNTITYMRMGGISTANKKSALKEYQQALLKNGYNRFLIGIFGTLKKIILYLKQNN